MCMAAGGIKGLIYLETRACSRYIVAFPMNIADACQPHLQDFTSLSLNLQTEHYISTVAHCGSLYCQRTATERSANMTTSCSNAWCHRKSDSGLYIDQGGSVLLLRLWCKYSVKEITSCQDGVCFFNTSSIILNR